MEELLDFDNHENLLSSELIMSKYVAESITMIAGRSSIARPLSTAYSCTKAFVAKTSCNHCY